MEFRWVAVLALWTMLSGPILSQPSPPRPAYALAARPIVSGARPVTVSVPANPVFHAGQ